MKQDQLKSTFTNNFHGIFRVILRTVQIYRATGAPPDKDGAPHQGSRGTSERDPAAQGAVTNDPARASLRPRFRALDRQRRESHAVRASRQAGRALRLPERRHVRTHDRVQGVHDGAPKFEGKSPGLRRERRRPRQPEMEAGVAALRKQDQEALIEAIIDEVAEAVCVVGTPDEARRKVARYAGVTTMPRFMSVGPRAKGICPREPRSHRGDVYRLLAASPSRERDRQIMTSNTAIKRAYADTKYGQVHYRHTGSGDPLVLMHWCPGNGRQYQNTLAQFAERGYAAFAPDLAGYGDSDKPDRQWSIEDFAVNLGEFLDFLHLDSVLPRRRPYLGGNLDRICRRESASESGDWRSTAARPGTRRDEQR